VTVTVSYRDRDRDRDHDDRVLSRGYGHGDRGLSWVRVPLKWTRVRVRDRVHVRESDRETCVDLSLPLLLHRNFLCHGREHVRVDYW